jgi:hypothetical protein
LLVVTIGIGACGGSDGDGSGAGSTTRTTRTTRTVGDAAAAFVGLSKRAAVAKAEADGRPWRIGREDDERFLLTQDLVENRVTFEIDDGEVTAATLG